jgi:alkylated DNA repair dioxygenase AlkB
MALESSDAVAENLPPGLALATDVITPEEETQLISLIEACGPRRYPGDERGGLSAISFGWQYDMSNGHFSPCEPMPEGFVAVRDLAARFAGLVPESITQCLFNRYEKGAEIPWHIDKPIWEHVIGISLGAPTTMGFRKASGGDYQYAAVTLLPRSIYFMSGEARYSFAHSIPPMAERRWSITFRTFSVEGEKLRASFCD